LHQLLAIDNLLQLQKSAPDSSLLIGKESTHPRLSSSRDRETELWERESWA
jgi:hypothetical protein